MQRAKVWEKLESDVSNFWRGYQMGMRRLFHGEVYGDPEQHHRFMTTKLSSEPDAFRQQLIAGYRSGYGGYEANIDLPKSVLATLPNAKKEVIKNEPEG